jgi:hypothetical protein
LTMGKPGQLQEARPWAGLLARAAASRTDLLARNLVNCGLITGRFLPCWFADDIEVALSDGTHSRRVPLPWIRAADVDVTTPLRDVAFVGRDRVWVLAASNAARGRRAGGRLHLGTVAGRELARVDLNPPARALLFATESSCVLLTVSGELMEVVKR